MPNPQMPAAPAAKAPVAAAANPPAAQANALAIDERFARLAAQFMSQVNAALEAFRTEFQAQFSTNVDPLQKDLHDLLDQQMQAAARMNKLEAANFVTPEDMQKQVEGLGDAIAEKLAPKIQPVIQPAITVTDKGVEDRLAKIENKLRYV